MSPRFQLELDRERYAPGDVIRGTIRILQGGGSRSVEALLEYKEETEDYLEVEFELTLPRDALPNYRSKHGELYWELDVKSDEAGRDTHERRRIEIDPAPRSD